MKREKTTIYDLAEYLKLSPSTVSRAINLHPRISDKTILRVKQAMEDLQYTPAPLHTRQSHRKCAFGIHRKPCRILVLWNSLYSVISYPDYWQIADQSDWHGVPFQIKVDCFDNARKLLPETDAVLLYSGVEDASQLRRMLRYKAVVQVRGVQNPEIHQFWDQITYDNRKVGEMAARFLIGKGCRHLAFITPTNAVAMQRLEQFQTVCREQGVAFTIFRQPFVQLDSFVLNRHIADLESKTPQITGMYIFNTIGAISLYQTMLRNGIRPERDIRIITTDNLGQDLNLIGIQEIQPRPATISIREPELLQIAFNRLLWRLRHREAPPQTIMLAPHLIHGEIP